MGGKIRQKEKKQQKSKVLRKHLDTYPNNTIFLKQGKILKTIFSSLRLVGAIGSACDS